jgi:adenylate kinase family enzyme
VTLDGSPELAVREPARDRAFARRIVVGGTSGAGKSTLGRRLSSALGITWYELDSYFHGPNWTPQPDFRDRVDEITRGERWIADGNYGLVRDFTWGRAEMLIWLDYSMARVMRQLLPRIVTRSMRREELWNGNREDIRTHLFKKESLIWWVLSTHHRRRRQWPEQLRQYAQLRIVRLRSPRELEHWLARVLPPPETPAVVAGTDAAASSPAG